MKPPQRSRVVVEDAHLQGWAPVALHQQPLPSLGQQFLSAYQPLHHAGSQMRPVARAVGPSLIDAQHATTIQQRLITLLDGYGSELRIRHQHDLVHGLIIPRRITG
ncbi:hypothetical protein [Streptomyces sp. ISL-10]|uniref:hypothetical protein n=1 Tax=Streptomyces sp. ISL-10 TaxID=2819172 RepID=UPI002035C11B|nr:hypothetical protein [Streptomyces sp. ISL-10]